MLFAEQDRYPHYSFFVIDQIYKGLTQEETASLSETGDFRISPFVDFFCCFAEIESKFRLVKEPFNSYKFQLKIWFRISYGCSMIPVLIAVTLVLVSGASHRAGEHPRAETEPPRGQRQQREVPPWILRGAEDLHEAGTPPSPAG
jgi:hypothetical protein